MELIGAGCVMGVLATVFMDVWAIILNRAFGLALPNWAMVGRWVGHLHRGRLFHDDIAAASPIPREHSLGWAFHYLVGAAYGVIFLWLLGADWLAEPRFLPAWIFSIATVAAGWFLLQPGLGLGIAAARTPAPWRVRGLNLLAHTVFALGLWTAGLALS